MQQVGGSEWKVALRICSAGRAFKISDFTICVILLHPGNDNGGDLYELAKILGDWNIKVTERYAKLGRQHIARTGNTAREVWRLLEQKKVEE